MQKNHETFCDLCNHLSHFFLPQEALIPTVAELTIDIVDHLMLVTAHFIHPCGPKYTQ